MTSETVTLSLEALSTLVIQNHALKENVETANLEIARLKRSVAQLEIIKSELEALKKNAVVAFPGNLENKIDTEVDQ